jgi:glycosyltransferase A (GT-A) superfamily protein (DUF2064 family)
VSAAALVVARAPGDPGALPALAAQLGVERAAALQALLIRRAAAWAAAAAPGAAYVALMLADGAHGEASAGDAAGSRRAGAGPAVTAAGELDAVAELVPPGVAVFAASDLAAAVAHFGRGPLLVAGAGCPRLGAAHAAAALADLEAGCDVVFGSTLEGGWYVAGLREPRPELLSLAALRHGGIGAVLRRAGELGVEVGLLRHERMLATPDDAAALVADPLVDAELRAALSA